MKAIPNEHYLRLAKELTGSSNIDDVISSANKLAVYFGENHAAQYHAMAKIEDFAKTCRIQHPIRGAINFIPFDYQTKLLKEMKEPGSLIINMSRQLGLSLMLSVFSLHEAITKDDQTIVIVAPSFAMAQDQMSRIRFMIEESKNSLWPGITTYNKDMIAFENGSRIIARAATIHSLRGLSANTLILSDAAYYSYSKDEELWNSWYPTIATGGKLIMSSTPKLAKGLFYKLWNDNNGFRKSLIKWDAHPERDEVWKTNVMQSLGPVSFSQEYECQFILPDASPESVSKGQ